MFKKKLKMGTSHLRCSFGCGRRRKTIKINGQNGTRFEQLIGIDNDDPEESRHKILMYYTFQRFFSKLYFSFL